MDSFYHHLDELVRVVNNTDRVKELLQVSGVLCYAAYMGSNPVVVALIQKGVGKK